MRPLIALIFLCLFSVSSVLAQQIDRYTISGYASLGASDYTVTIRQPATGGKRLEIESIVVQAIGGEITAAVERDCSTVTTTSAITPVAVNAETAPAAGNKFQAYKDSAASSCTSFNDFTPEKGWHIPDRAMLAIPAQGTFKEGSGVTKNINLRLAGSGYVAIYQILLREAR